MGVELEADMLTIKPPIARVAKSQHSSCGTGYEGHEFFEASSMRKFNGRYYFIYSSVNGHELCYAVGNSPLGEFKYGGTLVSIGDVGLSEKPLNYLGNTHGSVEKIGDKYFVFYHRQTNRHCHSRQACAEEITLRPDGTFEQAEVTSCGLNGGPLRAAGEYDAAIACHLYSKRGVKFYTFKTPKGCHPYFTQSGRDRENNPDQYIANFCDGATAGFKYFEFKGNEKIAVEIEGKARGKMCVREGICGGVLCEIPIDCKGDTATFSAPSDITSGANSITSSTNSITSGIKSLYFTYHGKGKFKFKKIKFS